MSVFKEQLLAGRTALVTGGGSGIGQRMAERFAEHGAKVMIVGRKQEKLDAAAAVIREWGGKVSKQAIAEAIAISDLVIKHEPFKGFNVGARRKPSRRTTALAA